MPGIAAIVGEMERMGEGPQQPITKVFLSGSVALVPESVGRVASLVIAGVGMRVNNAV